MYIHLQNVIFTDESKIEQNSTGRRSYRKTGQAPLRKPKPKHPYSFLVWGGISMRGSTPLVIFNGIMDSIFYQEHILGTAFVPFVNHVYPDGHRLYQDNDPKHTSRSTQAYMEQHNINWWKSPPESPDINPIENLWHDMKDFLNTKVRPRNKSEFEEGLHTYWATVTPDKCRRYIRHIHKVMPAVIKNKGGPTKY